MARGSQQATTAGTSAQNLSNSLAGNAQSLYGALEPQLMTEATHPAGYAPADLAAMRTAAEQSAGGSQAAAVGQGSLLASRTRNAGSADAAIGQSVRTAGQNLSKADLGIETGNANLKQKQQQAGLGGLEHLYGTDVGSSIGALGIVPQAVNANSNAANSSWDWARYLLDPAMAGAASGVGAAFGG